MTRLSHELEDYAKKILPFDLTTNSVKFSIPVAMKLLMDKHGHCEYVVDGDTVTMAATVDGGALAWKLTQVSAGIKYCDERTINPHALADCCLVLLALIMYKDGASDILYMFVLKGMTGNFIQPSKRHFF